MPAFGSRLTCELNRSNLFGAAGLARPAGVKIRSRKSHSNLGHDDDTFSASRRKAMQISPYLNFPGQAEEAMNFYAQALGGTLTPIHRFGTMPGSENLPEAMKNRVMHVGLDLPGGGRIMASDTVEGMGPPHVAGTNMSISIHPSSREEADRIFAALSVGAEIGMPLADQFWGDYYGHLTDRFGIPWMVNFHAGQ
jgi:PhnB protein